MAKVGTLRNIITLISFLFLISCQQRNDDPVYGQWKVQSVSSDAAYISDVSNQNFSLNVKQLSPDGSSVQVSDASGEADEAAVRYKNGNNMIVEYHDPQTGERVLVEMKK